MGLEAIFAAVAGAAEDAGAQAVQAAQGAGGAVEDLTTNSEELLGEVIEVVKHVASAMETVCDGGLAAIGRGANAEMVAMQHAIGLAQWTALLAGATLLAVGAEMRQLPSASPVGLDSVISRIVQAIVNEIADSSGLTDLASDAEADRRARENRMQYEREQAKRKARKKALLEMISHAYRELWILIARANAVGRKRQLSLHNDGALIRVCRANITMLLQQLLEIEREILNAAIAFGEVHESRASSVSPGEALPQLDQVIQRLHVIVDSQIHFTLQRLLGSSPKATRAVAAVASVRGKLHRTVAAVAQAQSVARVADRARVKLQPPAAKIPLGEAFGRRR